MILDEKKGKPTRKSAESTAESTQGCEQRECFSSLKGTTRNNPKNARLRQGA